MPSSRLTHDECRSIAKGILRTLDDLNAAEALRRYPEPSQEILVDGATGKSFRCTIHAQTFGGESWLWVGIVPEPEIVRPARRLKVVADLIDGWRNAPTIAHRMLEPEPSDAP